MDDLEARVKRQEDLEDIRELQHRYAHMVWQQAGVALVDLFTEDGVFHTGDKPPFVGRAGLTAYYADQVTWPNRSFPYVHQQVINLDGDRATCRSYMDIRVSTGRIMGSYYDDELVRTTEGWKFKKRRHVYVYINDPQYKETVQPRYR